MEKLARMKRKFKPNYTPRKKKTTGIKISTKIIQRGIHKNRFNNFWRNGMWYVENKFESLQATSESYTGRRPAKGLKLKMLETSLILR